MVQILNLQNIIILQKLTIKNKANFLFKGSYQRDDLPHYTLLNQIFIYCPSGENFSHCFFEAILLGLIPFVPNTIPWRFNDIYLDNLLFFDQSSIIDFKSKLTKLTNLSITEFTSIIKNIKNSELISKINSGNYSAIKKIFK